MKNKFKFIAVEPLSKKQKPQATKASSGNDPQVAEALERILNPPIMSEAHRREVAFDRAVKYMLWTAMLLMIAGVILYFTKYWEHLH